MAPKYLRQIFEQPRLRTSISIATVVGGTLLAAAVISPAMTAEAVKQGLKLAFFCSGGDNDYQLTGIRAAKETAAKYGASVQYYDAHFDTAKQLNQIMSATSSGNFEGFVIEAINASTVCSSVKAALQKNIVVAMTNVQACDAPYEVPYPGTVAMVGGQAASVYEEWFKRGFDTDPEGGEFAVLVGPITQGNSVRAKAVLDKLQVELSEMETRRLRRYWLQRRSCSEEDARRPSGTPQAEDYLLQLFRTNSRRHRGVEVGRHARTGEDLRYGWRQSDVRRRQGRHGPRDAYLPAV